MFYIKYRAYDKNNNVLCTPHNTFINYIRKLEKLFFSRFYILAMNSDIVKSYVQLFAENIDYVHPCPQFPYYYLLKLNTRVRLFYTLKFININFTSQKGHQKNIIINYQELDEKTNEALAKSHNRKVIILTHK